MVLDLLQMILFSYLYFTYERKGTSQLSHDHFPYISILCGKFLMPKASYHPTHVQQI